MTQTRAKLSIREVAYFLGNPVENSLQSQRLIEKYVIDSRQVIPGSLFFALPGQKTQGDEFLQEVAQRGGITAVVSANYRGESFGLILIYVEEVQKALHLLARQIFSERREKVIGITGSMGKTTSKEFLAHLLSARYKVERTEGNQNTQATLPLTLLNLGDPVEWLVLEMSMSLPGHIEKLISLAPPETALVTRIAPAGMENFQGGLEAIACAKAEILGHPHTRYAVVSAQAASFSSILQAGALPKIVYGWKEEVEDFRTLDFFMEKKEGGVVVYEKDGSHSPVISLPFTATHLAENFLAAASIARMKGISWFEIQEKAAQLKPYNRRFQTIEREGITFIQDCYNANPDSVRAALKNLPTPKLGGRRIGVLGMMPDLGEASALYHEEVGRTAAEHLDLLLCLGKETEPLSLAFRKSKRASRDYTDFATMKQELWASVQPGDVVLIKGANSLGLWRILEDA